MDLLEGLTGENMKLCNDNKKNKTRPTLQWLQKKENNKAHEKDTQEEDLLCNGHLCSFMAKHWGDLRPLLVTWTSSLEEKLNEEQRMVGAQLWVCHHN